MVFTLRVQSPNGTKRLNFPSAVTSTWADLQKQITEVFSIPAESQLISLQPLHNPNYVTAAGDMNLAALGFKHGDMLYLAEPLKASAPTESSKKNSITLTPDCQHGPNGRCVHCSALPVDYKPTASCNHGAGATCQNCSEYVKSESKEIASWLCNHPDYAFCPKCQPPEDIDGDAKKEKTCECVGTQKCVKCLNLKATYKVDVIPYAQMMAEKRALCKYKHDASTTCPMCAHPVEPSFKGDPNCRDGHRPWPLGMCGKCRPANANLRLQNYRHVDGISFKDLAVGEKFISEWQANPGIQRAAILFGKYIEEPVESQNLGAIRAEVYGLYMPPQEGTPTGVILMNDPYEVDVIEIGKSLGLVPVGWAITTLPRNTEGGDEVFMAGGEIRQAAKYQSKFSDEYGHSKFVTMVIQYNNEGVIEPRAYQISDLGVAMERDGLIQDGSKVETIAARKGKSKEYVPSIIFKDRALKPGEDFIPDELLVKVVAMRPYKPSSMFSYNHFPLYGGTKNHVLSYMKLHQGEEMPRRMSDFALLCFLPQVAGLDLACRIAQAVKDQSGGSDLTRELQQKLEGR